MKSMLPITAVLAVAMNCASAQAGMAGPNGDRADAKPSRVQLAQADSGAPEKPQPGAGEGRPGQGGGEPRPGGAPSGRPKPGVGAAGQAMPERPQSGQGEEGQPAPGGRPAKPGEPPRQGGLGRKGQPGEGGQPAEATPPSGGGAPRPGQGAAGAPRPGRVTLQGEQRTRIVTVIRGLDIRPVANIGVRVAVGAAIPRTVRLRPLPPEVVAVVPEYEGYLFFLAPEGIVVVDPDTFEVIDIIPA